MLDKTTANDLIDMAILNHAVIRAIVAEGDAESERTLTYEFTVEQSAAIFAAAKAQLA